MNKRIKNKQNKKVLLMFLEHIVAQLDGSGEQYRARVLRSLFKESRTITKINGYRIEIRSSREEMHNYAHFHVVKGSNTASIRIDTLQVLESSLPNKDLNRILKWAKEYREVLVTIWNEFHGYSIMNP